MIKAENATNIGNKSPFSWNDDSIEWAKMAREKALCEASSNPGWTDDQKTEAAASVSGSKTVNHSPNMTRRFSICAEPYTPNASKISSSSLASGSCKDSKSQELRDRIEKAVKTNLLFRSLDEMQLECIIDAMKERSIPCHGEKVITQGEEGDNFYFIEKGNFVVNKDSKDIVTLGPGDTFGQLALMYGSPRAASVISCDNDSILYQVDRSTFRSIVIDLSYQKRLLYEQFLRGIPLLETLMDQEIFRVCDALQPVFFEAGVPVVKEGEMGTTFYIIESGEAIVTKEGEDAASHTASDSVSVSVKILASGDYFGELSLIRDAPRAATVTSNPEGKGLKCLSLSKADFIRVLGPVMPILQRNEEHFRRYAQYCQL